MNYEKITVRQVRDGEYYRIYACISNDVLIEEIRYSEDDIKQKRLSMENNYVPHPQDWMRVVFRGRFATMVAKACKLGFPNL